MHALAHTDPTLSHLISQEEERQQHTIPLIPSENYPSRAVREAVGSILSSKYAEGYPGKRYYQGNTVVDAIERLAQDRLKALFGVPHVNVQAHSGSPANMAVYAALLAPGDTIMGLALSDGGHLTHGYPDHSFAGTHYTSVPYQVNEDGIINYDALKQGIHEKKPALIISGATAYPRTIDFETFGNRAKEIGAWHLADISHIAGLVVGGQHPSPIPHADVVTFTTHKTFRGPRGAVIMVTPRGLAKDPELPTKIDKAVFPFLQGGPHLHSIAGIAVAAHEAALPSFASYTQQVVENARVLSSALQDKGYTLISGGTDTHLMVMDMRPQHVDGWTVAYALETAGIIVNKNSIPGDTAPPFYPSGIRLGTPAATTRGMGGGEMRTISEWIDTIVTHCSKRYQNTSQNRRERKKSILCDETLTTLSHEVRVFAERFPLP